MILPELPADEAHRLATLRSLGLLDTPPEERFDRITRLAQRLFDVPIALVTLIDEDRQWFKSRQGYDEQESPRETSFCAHAILQDGVMCVPDAESDPRFADNPVVTERPGVRFYAGAPISAPDGSKLGTLCVIDREPRQLSSSDVDALGELAAMVDHEIATLQLALTDELTALSNRRGFLALGQKVLDVCARQGVEAVVVFLDLDGLKSVNDELGHEAGDELIAEVADLLRESLRTSDVLARLGGDEFCALLTGTGTADDALVRLLRGIEDRNRSSVGPHELSLSIGTATFDPAAPEPIDVLLRRADEVMYAHKRRRTARA